jgi:hypothetical protein
LAGAFAGVLLRVVVVVVIAISFIVGDGSLPPCLLNV